MNSDTVIIIVIFASLGLLFFLFVLSKLYRSLSATSNPLPPVQPLAHHRRPKSSLQDDDYILVDPHPLFYPRPTSSFSTSPSSLPRPSSNPRPTSVASSSSLTHSSGRRGLPHSPHSQINIILPAPLGASQSNLSTSEFGHVNLTPIPRRPPRHFLEVSSEYDRRSMSFVDRWLPNPSTDSHSDRVPSPLIPLSSSSSSSLILPQARKSVATTLRSPSNSYSNVNITLDPAHSDTESRVDNIPTLSDVGDNTNPKS